MFPLFPILLCNRCGANCAFSWIEPLHFVLFIPRLTIRRTAHKRHYDHVTTCIFYELQAAYQAVFV